MGLAGPGENLFPGDVNPDVYHKTFKTLGTQRCGAQVFAIFAFTIFGSTYATRLSAGGVADQWVTQLLRQGDANVFKKCSQMKLRMKREALAKMNRLANEGGLSFGTAQDQSGQGFGTVKAKGITKAMEPRSDNSFGIRTRFGRGGAI